MSRSTILVSIAYILVGVALAIVIQRTESSINATKDVADDTKVTVTEAKAISADTNRIVREDLAEVKATNGQLNYVLNQQAAPAIIYMLKLLKQNGIQAPEVLLSPSEPPFSPPQAVPSNPSG